jgi:hypothetical protein
MLSEEQTCFKFFFTTNMQGIPPDSYHSSRKCYKMGLKGAANCYIITSKSNYR